MSKSRNKPHNEIMRDRINSLYFLAGRLAAHVEDDELFLEAAQAVSDFAVNPSVLRLKLGG